MKFSRSGFTLVELVVISPIIIFSIGYTMAFLVDLYINTNELVAKLNLKSDTQNVLYRIQDDLFFASEFQDVIPEDIDSEELNDTDPNTDWVVPEADYIWDSGSVSGNYAVLVSSLLATDKPSGESDRQLVYIKPDGVDCGSSGYASFEILRDYAVYYIQKNEGDSNGKLYRRVVNGVSEFGNCPDGTSSWRVATHNPNGSTTPKDTILCDGVSSLQVTLYDNNDEITSVFDQATKAKIKVTLKDTVNGEDIEASSEVIIRKAN